VTRQTTTSSSAAARATSPIPPPSSSSVYRRRSSVSVSVPAGDRRRPFSVSRSLSSSLPQRTPPPPPAPASLPPVRRHLAAAAADVQTDVKLHLSTNDVPTPATVQAIFDVRKLNLCRFVENSDQPQRKYKNGNLYNMRKKFFLNINVYDFTTYVRRIRIV